MTEDTVTTPAPPASPPPDSPVAAPAPRPPGRRGSGAGTVGIVLIIIGLVFLVGRVVPAFGWWNLWPLIIVIAGLVQAFTPGKTGWSFARMFDGLTTVAFGGVFLAITFGLVGWSVWGTILSLWPLLVIAIGLDILGKSLDTGWFKVLGSLVVIGGLAYAVASNISGTGGIVWYTGDLERTEMSEPVGAVEEASLLVEAGAAEVELTSGERYLIDALGETPFGTPQFEIDRESDTADVALSMGSGSGMTVYPGGPVARMDAKISSDVIWHLTVKTGVSKFDADLRDVPVRSLLLQPGVAECDVVLGEPVDEGENTIRVEAGISTVTLELPRGVEARIESQSGLSGLDIANEFDEVSSDVWETERYERASKAGDAVWLIRVKSGIGTFRVETY